MEPKDARALDLSPAKWIWIPSERTLPNTFACFRRDFTVSGDLESAKGYVLADSRYVLSVNGRRVQFGPAPSDPRFEEADTADLLPFLVQGENTLGFRVLYYGHGDGTWVSGRAGMLYRIELAYRDGRRELLASDRDTGCIIDRSRPAGQYKRWYLRALQEEYDARRDVPDFDRPDCREKERFEPAMELPGRADKPSSLNGNTDYLYDAMPWDVENACIRRREIPMPREEFLPVKELYHCGTVEWKRDPEDWFQFRHPDSFTIREGLEVSREGEAYAFDMPQGKAAYLTFRMPEEGCGFIDLTVEAPEGTVIEAIVQEGHRKENTLWLDSQFYSWTRFICREGENHFISFDFECFAYLQLHFRGTQGRIRVKRAGMLRRTYPVGEPLLRTEDPKLQRLFDAGVNTLRNSAVETFVDGMARERQQYSGDCNHQVYAFSYLYGPQEPAVRRYYETFGDGMSLDGYYIDCWPGWDRMNRLAQVQVGMSMWSPILDHGVEFAEAAVDYAFQSGDSSLLQRDYPNFRKQADYLLSLRREDGLISPEDTGSAYVWLDHKPFRRQRDKKCCFNLHAAALLLKVMAPLCERFGGPEDAERYQREGNELLRRTTELYYSPERGLFFDNLPTWREDGELYVVDRTLAVSLIYGLLPGPSGPTAEALAGPASFVSRSYPANAVWRMKALAKAGRCDAITREFRSPLWEMESLAYNNTLSEEYHMEGDSKEEWSHCPQAPVLAAFECYGGLRCEAERFRAFSLRPCLGGLPSLEFLARTPSGNILFQYKDGLLKTEFDPGMEGRLYLPGREPVKLEPGKTYELPPEAR